MGDDVRDPSHDSKFCVLCLSGEHSPAALPPRRGWLRRLFDDPCCIGGEMAQCAGCGDFEACDAHHECPGGGWL